MTRDQILDMVWVSAKDTGYQRDRVMAFQKFMQSNDHVVQFANIVKAPWHLQIVVAGVKPRDPEVLVNAWVHKDKYQCEGHKVHLGLRGLGRALVEAKNDIDNFKSFDVTEDY